MFICVLHESLAILATNSTSLSRAYYGRVLLTEQENLDRGYDLGQDSPIQTDLAWLIRWQRRKLEVV